MFCVALFLWHNASRQNEWKHKFARGGTWLSILTTVQSHELCLQIVRYNRHIVRSHNHERHNDRSSIGATLKRADLNGLVNGSEWFRKLHSERYVFQRSLSCVSNVQFDGSSSHRFLSCVTRLLESIQILWYLGLDDKFLVWLLTTSLARSSNDCLHLSMFSLNFSIIKLLGLHDWHRIRGRIGSQVVDRETPCVIEHDNHSW
mmetsp:Transcript_11151/g.41661  ORF Transcript_11151/g.41661 Transcript_11151/m.41661 type:complete len:203 (+) Transcript_11151:961-1569(+)